MKKALSVLLAGAMLAGVLAGCGGGNTNENSSNNEGAEAFKIGGTGP